jgi:hypothetical protein
MSKESTVPTPVTDLESLPVILTLKEMSAIYRVSPLTIRRALSLDTFRPLPFEKYPYRWLRADVVRDLATRRPKLRQRRHGFAAVHARRAAERKGWREVVATFGLGR